MATAIHFLQKQRHGRSGRKRRVLCVVSVCPSAVLSHRRQQQSANEPLDVGILRLYHLHRPELSLPFADPSSISQGQCGINTINSTHDAMPTLITHWQERFLSCFHFARSTFRTFVDGVTPRIHIRTAQAQFSLPSLRWTPSNWTFPSRHYLGRPIISHSLGNWHAGVQIHL